ncbi:hypothetical protein CASFOL_004258 [Castilleja foliolosa]|uniref:Late embryogenesis abundant protein LEA-2 subgroup domain-containing protein n=1 Tax=Castilleja foliolosa TaxID=1961234 RepID=A0ABD3EAQ3_9LAMI
MSQATENSPNDPTKQPSDKLILLFIFLLSLIIMLILLISITLLVWLISDPVKPELSITWAHVDRLNLTRPSTLDSSMHLIIRSYNPNSFEIYYDDILVHASYQGQKITKQVEIPPYSQDDHEETYNTCAYLVGNEKIVGNQNQVESDLRAGKLKLNFEISGNLRWETLFSKSRAHMFNINCVAIMSFGTSYVEGPFNCSTTHFDQD